MSYQVLARKWRPKDFSQLMGQEHVVTVLVNALNQERLHHAYLFTGTRGVGKTTIARIFAKSLNCQTGITSTPCGQCDVCQDVDAGRFIDLLEIDAASRTKVDDTREILDNVQYAPSRGRFKVYLIDEVHMLSKSSFNALLKTLEEPPQHVKFILATTDPQKLPVTVLSRCLQFHLKALTPQQIEQKLKEILTAEEVSFEPGTLALLAKAARGSMRDSLSLTDQAIAQGQGHLKLDNLQAMLGGVDQSWIYKILIALIKQQPQELLSLSQTIASYAPSYHRLLAELLQLLHQIAMWQLVPNSVDVDEQRATLLHKFANAMSPQDVQLYYQIVLNGRKDLPYSGDEQAGFDMVLLRLLAFKPATQTDFVDNRQHPDAQHQQPQSVVAKSTEPTPQDTGANEPTQTRTDEDDTSAVITTNMATESLTPSETLARPTPSEDINSLNAQQEELESMAQQMSAEQYTDNAPIKPQSQSAEVAQSQELLDSAPVGVEQEHTEQVTSDNAKPSAAQAHSNPSTDTERLLQTRNLLRSRKKASEGRAKKPELKSQQPTGKTVAPTSMSATEHIEQVESNKQRDSAVETIPERPHANEQATSQAMESQEGPQVDTSSFASQEGFPLAPSYKVEAEPELTQADQNMVQPTQGQSEAVTLNWQHRTVFSADTINPNIITRAAQIDFWAHLIDAMQLGGRVRQLTLNATLDESSNAQHLIINLAQSYSHINSSSALQSIQQSYSLLVQHDAQVDIHIVEDPGYTPLLIQNIIDQKRHENAILIIKSDDFVQRMQGEFAAEIDETSIQAK
ncbi:DNA polymerase III subunit gamma/tau [Thalassotalea aquiviva]|uniref:DNA polymerase III subunit gamma/tau n=1 Tax=Thalassotalea aquiviva TaxID=3242415 RepID=UPI00352AD268